VLILVLPLVAAQRYVVGEVFTAIWCSGCPAARSALLKMADNEESFPFFIPLIWQDDTNTSPGASTRRNSLYGSTFLPWIVFGGSSHIWPYSDEIFANHYNTISNLPSRMELDIDYQITGLQLSVSVNYRFIEGITNENTRMVILLTYDWGSKQQPSYDASVVGYNDRQFMLTTAGHSGTFDHTFTLNPTWIIENISIVAFAQSFGGNREIHQAARERIPNLPEPVNARSFSSPKQISIVWDAPDTAFELLGYNIRRNGQLLNTEPHKDTFYTDTDIQAGTTYVYTVNSVYMHEGQIAESPRSSDVTIAPVAGFIQLGSGGLLNEANSPSPVNTTNASLRGQFIYTAEELRFAGLKENDEITQFGFFVHDTFHSFPEFHVRIKHTAASESTEHDDGPFVITHVLESYRTARNDWDMIELPEAFIWNGTDNILFDTAFTRVSFPMESGQVRIINTQNGYRFGRHNTQSQVNAETTGIRHYRPQIRINFDMDIEVELNPPRNLTLTGSDGEPPHFVRLEWEAPIAGGSTVQGYRIYKNGEYLEEKIESLYFVDNEVEPDILYTYHVIAIYDEGVSIPSNIESITIIPTSDFDEVNIPIVTSLGSNFPNPFNPETTIRFEVQGSGFVKIEVFNIRGQIVRTLLDGSLEFGAGRHSVVWDGTDDQSRSVSSGIYLYRMTAGEYSATKRMILMK